MTAWRIRRGGPDDEDAAVRLEALAFGARSWGAKNVRESFAAAHTAILLASDAGAAPSGFAIWRDLGGAAELLAIGVVPADRGKGAGAALVQAVLHAARRAGAVRVHLEVDAGVEAARALYKRAGFEPVSVRRSYYRDGADAVIMQAVL